MRLAERVVRMGERRVAYMALMGRPGGKRPHERLRRRCEGNIKMYIQEIIYREGSRLD